MRLPRAEDRVVAYVAVDGEMMEIEGVVQSIRLHASAGINLLTGKIERDRVHPNDGTLVIDMRSMVHVNPDELQKYEVLDGDGDVVQTIVVREAPRAIPPSP